MRIPRQLDPIEVRVLGALLEKQQTTPDYYPLTLNALVAACNQKSNRNPVMSLSDEDVRNALDRLHDDVLIWSTQGARVQKWRHNLDRRWELETDTKAVMTLLMLRGPQTPGELRNRSERMHQFATPNEVEGTLLGLAGGEDPLVVQLARRPGQTERRWTHLLEGEPADEPSEMPIAGSAANRSLVQRVDALEDKVAQLSGEIAKLKELLE
jgi:uncharacterized protein YceH (UPF0502 family)